MIFGQRATTDALGCILAHSVRAGDSRLRKGRVLSEADLDALITADIATVTVAQLEPGDMDEDSAAAAIATAMDGPNITVNAPFTGRANLYADRAGIVQIDPAQIQAVNRVDETITLATLPNMTRVAPRQMLATVKIIPYGAPKAAVATATKSAARAIGLHTFQRRSVTLIQTRLPGTPDRMLDKGTRVTADRLTALGLGLEAATSCDHSADAIAAALRAATSDLILILGASATSDRADVCPAGLIAAGGQLIRFGMPVDPGNLLFLGKLGDSDVLGLPGCARSPALNGADWVLERLAAGLAVSDDDIAAMGVGGLLKEIPTRPQPRGGNVKAPTRPFVEAIILAAGASSRMRGADKLLETIDGKTQLARIADACLGAQFDRVQVVTPVGHGSRQAALGDRAVVMTEAVAAAEGMAASIRAGMAARSAQSDAVMLILADMPEVTTDHLNRLISAFDPGEGRTIVQATSATGLPGHPVLFGRRFYEALEGLDGDTGARDVVRDGMEYCTRVATQGDAAITDLDTPEAWTAWRSAHGLEK